MFGNVALIYVEYYTLQAEPNTHLLCLASLNLTTALAAFCLDSSNVCPEAFSRSLTSPNLSTACNKNATGETNTPTPYTFSSRSGVSQGASRPFASVTSYNRAIS